MISQNDQQQLLPNRHKQPKSQRLSFSVEVNNMEFDEGKFAFRSLGPLMSAIAAALVTHKNVPSIFAMVLKLRIFIGSYPTMEAATKVMAGTRLKMALPADDEAKYKPSKFTIWLIVILKWKMTMKCWFKVV